MRMWLAKGAGRHLGSGYSRAIKTDLCFGETRRLAGTAVTSAFATEWLACALLVSSAQQPDLFDGLLSRAEGEAIQHSGGDSHVVHLDCHGPKRSLAMTNRSVRRTVGTTRQIFANVMGHNRV